MQFCLLRSGSSGNCTLVEHDRTRVLIDAGGYSQVALRAMLAEVHLEPTDIAALVVSHLHSDHLNPSALRLCQAHRIPLWLHKKNVHHLHRIFAPTYTKGLEITAFGADTFDVAAIRFLPFQVPHDAAGVTCGFRFCAADNAAAVCYATDLGHFPRELTDYFLDTAAVVIEANHDTELLWSNPRRPEWHKRRVAGTRGHLSNVESAEALVRIARGSKRAPSFAVLGHLSEDHNTPSLAVKTVDTFLSTEGIELPVTCAHRTRRSVRFSLDGPAGRR
jgi:phosphoribosyl 1,2-cyclic phosphodiesterase